MRLNKLTTALFTTLLLTFGLGVLFTGCAGGAAEQIGEDESFLRVDCDFPNCLHCPDNFWVGECQYGNPSGDCTTQICTYARIGGKPSCATSYQEQGTMYKCIDTASYSGSSYGGSSYGGSSYGGSSYGN